MYSSNSRLALAVVSLLMIILINGCSPSVDTSSQDVYSVDPTFVDFYREFGGVDTLGPAISSLFKNEGVSYQYVVSGLMTYDPDQEPLKRFNFSPIASTELQINGLVEPAPLDDNSYYVNGHQIWEEIWSYYDQYGSEIIGLPVTGVTVNDVKQRYEQYFEGIGFFRNYSDPPGKIQLMPYGSWMCGSKCQYQVSDAIPPTPFYSRNFSATEQLFLQESERLGYGYTGAPLGYPRLGSDGFYEMVFENVILYLNPSDGNQIRARPLPSLLGIQADQPGEAKKEDGLSFYQIQDGLGLNVPIIFSDYISQHGTLDYSGNPITEYHNLADGGYSQCFTNICLEYHPTAPTELKVRPHSLGSDYLSMGTNSSISSSSITNALQINSWEEYPLIPSGEIQVIYIEATQNNTPMSGIEFTLIVTQPDGITKTYTLKPTGEDGITSSNLDPINGPNGAIVQYEVCVIGKVSPQVCFSKSYTIWGQ